MGDDWDPNQKYAFIDYSSKVLWSWGYMATNCSPFRPQCDIRIPVEWTFDLTPGSWQYDDSVTPPVWVAYP